MKLRHNFNGWCPDRTDPEWAERVEREAAAHTHARRVAYEKAQRRLARAVAKVESAARSSKRSDSTAMAALRATVERRRQELLTLERLMVRSPQGSQHRGTASHRTLPPDARTF